MEKQGIKAGNEKTGKMKRDAAKGVPSGFGGFRIVILRGRSLRQPRRS